MDKRIDTRRLSRRQALAWTAGAAAGLALPAARAQAWPARPVRIVVPFGPGGPADLYARLIGQALQESMGQSFVVENRPGAGAVIGTDSVAKSPADGYTLLMMSNSLTVNETLIPNKPYRLMRDLMGVAPVNYSDLVLVASPQLGARTVADLVRLAKAKPGGLSYASSGPGTPYHMAGEMFKVTAGIQAVHVPYRNSAAARTDVMGGQVDFMFDALPGMVANIQSNKVVALASTGAVRSTVLPDLPTVRQSGYADFETSIWNGIMAPRGTPAAVIEQLNTAIRRVIANPEVAKTWVSQGTIPMALGAAEFDRFIEADVAKWADVVKRSGVKVDS